MGLKVIGYGPYKSGKSVFGLTLAEVGPIGVIDTEDRMEWYTMPPPAPVAVQPFPFDNPRVVRPLPTLRGARHPIYLVQTKEVARAGQAIEAWTRRADITGIVIDSGSVLWDLLQDTRDDSDPRTAMLSWSPIKKTVRRLMYASMSGGKHLYIAAHAQDVMKKVGREMVTVGTRPWLEKKTPHWADITLEFTFPDDAPHPVARVAGEGVGGQGGLVRGAVLGDYTRTPPEPAPTFPSLLRRLSFIAPDGPQTDPDEVAYRNQTAVDAIGGSKPIPDIDGPDGETR